MFFEVHTLNRKSEECTLTLCNLSLTFNSQVKHQWKGNEMFFWEWVVVFGGSIKAKTPLLYLNLQDYFLKFNVLKSIGFQSKRTCNI